MMKTITTAESTSEHALKSVATGQMEVDEEAAIASPRRGNTGRQIRATPLQAWTSLKVCCSLLGLCLLASACKDSKVEVAMGTIDGSALPSGAQPNAGQGHNKVAWHLAHWVENNQPIILVPQAQITLSWEQGSINGSGGCNQFGAAYREVDGRIVIDPINATKRACEGPTMDQENRFFEALQHVRQATLLSNERLTLTYGVPPKIGTLVFTSR